MPDSVFPTITPTGSTPPTPINPSDKGESIDQIRKLGERVEKADLPDLLKENLLERCITISTYSCKFRFYECELYFGI